MGNRFSDLEAGVNRPRDAPTRDGNRRTVTVAFFDLSGYTALNEHHDPEVVADAVRELKAEAEAIIARYSGIVNQFVGDGIVALFGVPVAHDDDPIRCVEAALELHARVRELSTSLGVASDNPLRLHTGISTGPIVVDAQSDPREGRYAITGSAVNLGARLASTAHRDEILVSPTTARSVAPYFVLEPLEPILYKGVSAPVAPDRVIGRSDVDTRFEASRSRGLSPFRGRDADLNLLNARLVNARQLGGQLVTIIGEPGIGKTRLLHQFRESIDPESVAVLEGRCRLDGQTTAYLPFIEGLRRELDLHDGAAPDLLAKQIHALITGIEPQLETFIPLYVHLLSIPSDLFPLPASLTGEKLGEAIDDAIVELVCAISRSRQVVVVLEDWHWADPASLSVFDRMLERYTRSPILLVALCRPEYQPRPGQLKHQTEVVLGPLPRAQCEAIATWALNVRPTRKHLIEQVAARAGGNPLFVEELCEELLASRTDGSALDDAQDMPLPPSVEAVIRSRVDRLPQLAQRALETAAVIGQEFSFQLISAATQGVGQIADTLDALERLDLIQSTRISPDREYRFKHALTQSVVYGGILHARRKPAHAHIGTVIEQIHSGQIERHYETLAWHYKE
ncbi:MAG: AAA family ATPase, partial [Gammaproteobacteria bacterium]|nr:AAA family ATPase [Gammaproteobacteria bacterium]